MFLTPHWPGMPGNVGALSTLRSGGVSAAPYGGGPAAGSGGGLNLGLHVGDDALCVQRNRHLLQATLPNAPVWLSQVHGTLAIDAGAPASAQVPEADASFTRARAVVCAVLSADCLPVLLCDASGAVVGAAHAGWRGLAAGVLEQTVAAMRAAGAGEVLAWLGPAIGARQFEVGADVVDTFLSGALDQHAVVAAAFVPVAGRPGKYLADIYALARCALGRVGVDRIAGAEFCTASDEQRFYSYRRDGITGRQANLIWLK
ncbi:MAG: YfiH family protein [Janthinobacterium sp.]|jgi:YfiH family protein